MKAFSCKLCSKNMGEMEKGKIRIGYIILCGKCWEKADIAIQMAEMVRNQTSSGSDMPDFLQDLLTKKK